MKPEVESHLSHGIKGDAGSLPFRNLAKVSAIVLWVCSSGLR